MQRSQILHIKTSVFHFLLLCLDCCNSIFTNKNNVRRRDSSLIVIKEKQSQYAFDFFRALSNDQKRIIAIVNSSQTQC